MNRLYSVEQIAEMRAAIQSASPSPIANSAYATMEMMSYATAWETRVEAELQSYILAGADPLDVIAFVTKGRQRATQEISERLTP